MTIQKQAGVWLLALAVFIAIVWVLQDILLPFIAGFVLAYFLDPVADRLEKIGLPRLVATSLILVVAVSAVVIGVLIVVPVLADQAIKLAQDLPDLVKALVARVDEVTPQSIKDMLARAGGTSSGSLGDMMGKATGWNTPHWITMNAEATQPTMDTNGNILPQIPQLQRDVQFRPDTEAKKRHYI